MPQRITDDDMRAALAQTKQYTAVVLLAGPRHGTSDTDAIVWEHARRNFELRADGVLNIVSPVTDDSEVCGIGIFDADATEVEALMERDPGVAAGIFTYRIHPVRSFPGDQLR